MCRKRLLIYIAALLPCRHAAAQVSLADTTLHVRAVTVAAKAEPADIGVQKTRLDTLALRESVTASLADVLAQSSSIFIKSYGRGTLASASFRGTSPSHTQVLWNGLNINSPMLGMVDLSLIPSYLTDRADIYHGASSSGVTGGGLGGAVALSTAPPQGEGLGVKYIQGIASYGTFDEFLRITYGKGRWKFSTRALYSSSENDFEYTNYKKKIYDKDEQGNITGRRYPRERNRNGDFRDLHLLQEIYHDTKKGDRFSLVAWYTASDRGLPLLNVDRKSSSLATERQNEKTFRGTVAWSRSAGRFDIEARGGYIYTDFQYTKKGDVGDRTATIRHSKNYLHTLTASAKADYYTTDKLMLTGSISFTQHQALNTDRANRDLEASDYHKRVDQARPELSALLSARYTPTARLGVAVNLREEWRGNGPAKFIPAIFAEYSLTRSGTLKLKASATRNYRFPTLNDLYFIPGGNPDLRPERGLSYDAGIAYGLKRAGITAGAEACFFDSYISDWILWLMEPPIPTPVNVKKVHSYGLELKADLRADLGRQWNIIMNGNYTLTHSINRGEPFSPNDRSVGRQLPYIPRHSAAVTGMLQRGRWEFSYKWQFYSERYTTSSNDSADRIGRLGDYYMSDIALRYALPLKWGRISVKATVDNLLDEEYESVLSRPMPGRNYGIAVEIDFDRSGR